MRPAQLPALLLALLLGLIACSEIAELPPTPPARPTARPTPTAQPSLAESNANGQASATDGDTWLVMLYNNADDETLEKDIFTDVNEAEWVGSSEQVTIVAQLDRYKGAFRGDGNWTGTRRLLITQDDNLKKIGSEVVEDLGEVNMADGQTLIDFAEWAISSYPADHYVLILSDHGMGWPGGWNDPDPPEPGPDGLPLTADGDLLLLNELDEALGQIRESTGIEGFELIGFDACLMGHVEVLAAMEPHTRYVVASQEVEPSLGWAYASFLGALVADPAMDGATLSRAIVDSYIDQDLRITDDAARAEFIEETFNSQRARSARTVAKEMSGDVTLSAYDTAAAPELFAALDGFASALSAIDQSSVAEARTYAQSFENVFDDGPSPYIDMGSFATLIQDESGDDNAYAAAGELLAALSRTVIAEKHGDDRAGATGLSLYFPVSDLYEAEYAGAEIYATVANRFAEGTLWENYLNFHYYDVAMEDASAAPSGAASATPGASEISIADLELSDEIINQGNSVLVSSEIDGDQIGFVYFFTGYYNPDDDTILIADIDYIASEASRDVGGVFYPNWGDERPLALEYDWEPVSYGISDGSTTQFALFEPADYGDSDDSSTYTVKGIYSFADGGSRDAQLFFKDSELVKVLGFTDQGGAGAPREITPQTGDTFTVQNQLIRLNSDNDLPEEYFTEDGATITFGDTNLTLESLTAPAGDYVLGVQAEDMDGNLYESYTTVTVDE